jgi:hypothetical protein
MFIDRKEATRRVNNSTGVLSRINPSTIKPSNGNGSHPPVKDAHKDTEESSVPSITETPEEFSEGALKSLLNVKRARGQHGPLMSTKDRATLGLAGVLLGGRRAGNLLGRGPDTSHELRHGYLSQVKKQAGEQDEALVDELGLQKKTVRDLAFDRLISSVGLITHEKLEKIADVTKLAKVSRDLATVVDKTTPKEQAINNGVHFHIWKPEMKEESQYETINVNAPR